MSFKTSALAVAIAIASLTAAPGAQAQADYSIHMDYGLPLDFGGQGDPTRPGFLNNMGMGSGQVFTQDQIGTALDERLETVPVWGRTYSRQTAGGGNTDRSVSTGGYNTTASATSRSYDGLNVKISLAATGGQASADDQRYLGFQLNPHASVTFSSYATFTATGPDAAPVGAVHASSLAEGQGLTLGLSDEAGHFQTSLWARIDNPDLPPLPGLFTHATDTQAGWMSMTITNDQDVPLLGSYGLSGRVQGTFVTAVPEPGIASSLMLGLGVMGFLVRRSKRVRFPA